MYTRPVDPQQSESSCQSRRPLRLAAPSGAFLIFLFTFLIALGAWPVAGASSAAEEAPRAGTVPPALPNGVAAGDVDQAGAVLWARADQAGPVTFTYGPDLAANPTTRSAVATDPQVPVTVSIDGLAPSTTYHYRVTSAGISVQGRFRTPAAAGARPGLRFGVSGDWRGELGPYPALANAPERDLAFFVALGDTIYAGYPSPAVPINQAQTLAEYRRKHAEVYGNRLGFNILAGLRASTAIFATIDDHEVIDNFAGGAYAGTDPRFPETGGFINDTQLYANGLQAFLEYNPIRHERYGAVGGDGRMDGEHKLYRYRTFGSDAALFLLDARSFRDAPVAPIDPSRPLLDLLRFLAEAAAPGRTLLGIQQIQDLKDDLLDAQQKGITWKFVALPEPIQNLGPAAAEDRYEGYAAERTALLRYIHENDISGVVFISADIHGTVVNNLTYPGAPQSPVATRAFEVTTGPVAYDAPLGPTLVSLGVQYGLITPTMVSDYEALPIAPDTDDEPDDKDDFVKALINQMLSYFSYDPVGLAGSTIDATLVQGDYLAIHTYGWTEFEIAPDTQVLTVTTYGIDPYTEDDLAADPGNVIGRTPRIVGQFRVNPAAGPDTPTGNIYLPLVRR